MVLKSAFGNAEQSYEPCSIVLLQPVSIVVVMPSPSLQPPCRSSSPRYTFYIFDAPHFKITAPANQKSLQLNILQMFHRAALFQWCRFKPLGFLSHFICLTNPSSTIKPGCGCVDFGEGYRDILCLQQCFSKEFASSR